MRVSSQTTNPFTDEQYALVVAMKAEGKSWTEIGEACGHSANCCCSTYHLRKLRKSQGDFAHSTRGGGRPWTDQDVATLLRLRDVEGLQFKAIDARLKRPTGASNCKYRQLLIGASPLHGRPEPGFRVAVTRAELADRDARYQAKLLQSPAAALMGDPLPGRSALDLRRQGEA